MSDAVKDFIEMKERHRKEIMNTVIFGVSLLFIMGVALILFA